MNIITASKLKALSEEKKRQFEGLLPALVKRLILCSSKKLTSIRIPSSDDIWAPDFDGKITCNEESTYCAAGDSIWEFGTSSDSLKKLNSDYTKRTVNSPGINKKETTFYLVIPKTWAYKKQTLSEWETSHTEWKSVHVYDATVLCDWINSQPNVCAWLLEEIWNETLFFTTIKSAWEQLSHKTRPSFTPSIFLADRENDILEFKSLLSSKILRIQSDSYIDAQGFTLSALLDIPNYRETFIAVKDYKTYSVLSSEVTGKTFVLLYPCHHDLSDDSNNVIILFNKEDTSIRPDLNLSQLFRDHFIQAFIEMGMDGSQAAELYEFTHGSFRALTRRIPGTTNDARPDWVEKTSIDRMAPIVFMRQIHRDYDKQFIESLSGDSLSNIESEYKKLISIEDSPIKLVQNYYVLVNYEEAWSALNFSINDNCFTRLNECLFNLLSIIREKGQYEAYKNHYRLSPIIHHLLTNYIYFSFEDPHSRALNETINMFLDLANDIRVRNCILENSVLLAEASPDSFMRFIENDLQKKDSIISDIIHNSYDDQLNDILYGMTELTNHQNTAVRACRAFMELYKYSLTESNKRSLDECISSILCLWYSENALSLNQKKELLLQYAHNHIENGSNLIYMTIYKDTCFSSLRYGLHKNDICKESYTPKDYYMAIEQLTTFVLKYAYNTKNIELIRRFLNHYLHYSPAYIEKQARRFNKSLYSHKELFILNYMLREIVFSIENNEKHTKGRILTTLKFWIKQSSIPNNYLCWRFYKYYECPDNSLLHKSYEKEEQLTLELRKRTLSSIEKRQGIKGIIKLLQYIDNENNWGQVISSSLSDNSVYLLIPMLICTNKIYIICGIFDYGKKTIANHIFQTIPKERKKEFLSNIRTTDIKIKPFLHSKADKQAFWTGKLMREYDDYVYTSLLTYYPYGLLNYYRKLSQFDMKNNLDKIIEVLEAICACDSCLPYNSLEKHCLFDLVRNVDKEYYSDDWGKLCEKLFMKKLLNKYTNGLCIYYFYHPNMFIQMLEVSPFYEYSYTIDYTLPDCAYRQPGKLKHFILSLFDNHKTLIGSILGRTKSNDDNFPLNEAIRKMLEIINNSILDSYVYIGIQNNSNGRVIHDGQDMKQLGITYKNRAHSLDIEYPHTAHIFRRISDSYFSEANEDYIISEIT